jgi:hypothetical protein
MSLFLEAFEAKQSGEDQTAVFAIMTQGEQIFKYRRVADPSHAETFERLFWSSVIIDGVSGEDRVMSLLNGIFYPDAGEADEKIRRVDKAWLPKEFGVLIFSVSWRCSCWSKEDPGKVKMFEVELRSGCDSEFCGRLIAYSRRVTSANKHQGFVVIFSFLNSVSESDEFSWLGEISGTIQRGCSEEDIIEIHSFNLSQIAGMLRANDSIQFKGRELGVVGREWLKLLSIRYWATADDRKYVVPAVSECKAINSALSVLEEVSEEYLDFFIEDELRVQAMWRGARASGFQNGVLENFEEGFEKGIQYAMKNALKQETMRVFHRLFSKNFSVDEIAEVLELSVGEIEELMQSYQ